MNFRALFTTAALAALAALPTLADAETSPVPADAAAAAAAVARPPQFVLMAFDGSRSVPMWQETREFAAELSAQRKPLKFTYFINTAYYLAAPFKNTYIAPSGAAGRSAIGFGGTVAEVLDRHDQTNYAFQERHEIANHATGHFDGSKWTESQWMSELKQFYDLLFNLFTYNHAKRTPNFPNGWLFSERDVVGFRAPQLGLNPAMYATLPQFGIKYDTSRSAAANYWPKRDARGIWNFPLAEIPIAGTARKTLSMDYNFYYVQSKAKEAPGRSAEFEEQMYQSYMRYFQSNYNGNRAPINIGHHFSKWNDGAYWRAMKRMASAICGMPEVKCVTYQELMQYLERSGPRLGAYEQGQFEKAVPVSLVANTAATRTYDVQADLTLTEGQIRTVLQGRDSALVTEVAGSRVETLLNGKRVRAKDLTLELIRAKTPAGEAATIQSRVVLAGREIQSVTRKIENVGTAFEKLSDDLEAARNLIADPPEAHDEI